MLLTRRRALPSQQMLLVPVAACKLPHTFKLFLRTRFWTPNNSAHSLKSLPKSVSSATLLFLLRAPVACRRVPQAGSSVVSASFRRTLYPTILQTRTPRTPPRPAKLPLHDTTASARKQRALFTFSYVHNLAWPPAIARIPSLTFRLRDRLSALPVLAPPQPSQYLPPPPSRGERPTSQWRPAEVLQMSCLQVWLRCYRSFMIQIQTFVTWR